MKKRLFECVGGNSFRLASPQPMGIMSEAPVTPEIVKLIISRKAETNEWVVKVYANGVYDEGSTYYTDNKQDAIDTASAMRKKFQEAGWTVQVGKNIPDDSSNPPGAMQEMEKQSPAICRNCNRPLYADNQIECHHCGAIQKEILPNPQEMGKSYFMRLRPPSQSPGTVKEAKPSPETKLTPQERAKINKALLGAGLDGNGQFDKKEKGLSAITSVLDQLGFQLDMVTGDLIMGEKGTRNLPFRRANDPEQDQFTEKPVIENSRISFSWHLRSEYSYEIVAYAS